MTFWEFPGYFSEVFFTFLPMFRVLADTLLIELAGVDLILSTRHQHLHVYQLKKWSGRNILETIAISNFMKLLKFGCKSLKSFKLFHVQYQSSDSHTHSSVQFRSTCLGAAAYLLLSDGKTNVLIPRKAQRKKLIKYFS